MDDPVMENVGCLALTLIWMLIGIYGILAFDWKQWTAYAVSVVVVGWGYGRFVQSRRESE